MVTRVENNPPPTSGDHLEETKTLICALNLLSRNLPLPPHIFDSVSSIYNAGFNDQKDDGDVGSDEEGVGCSSEKDGLENSDVDELLLELESALVRQRPNCSTGAVLTEQQDSRLQSHIQHRLTELEDLQRKVRSDVSAEYWLRVNCACPDKQLFDWGMMRLRRPLYGVGDPFAVEADDQMRKKRDAERLSRLEEEERNRVETRKRKFFAEILNAAREIQLQVQAALKRRKQRNDGILAWHGRQRQRATRAEKLRFQALKADDQEAYMRMVEESKNERLKMLLGKTNDLLVSLGAAVQRQKDAEHADAAETMKDSEAELPELSASKSETEDMDIGDVDSNHHAKAGDLLDGQRQYNSAIHSIQEKYHL
ncbi:hypothetical protein RJ641_021222 [Dillenia turbinata]|uniref:HSA domain-containing protein n=1 Tax=Dillenia turbinata TaxID=194707 RepID=A0AAN8UMF0_9MAGN